ncbi:MAG TPA: glutaredoxin family protein [Caldimonas sp.]|jgi:glutaredoxin|nr:glutaredoxin family protein [Caldimonas sp.]HEX2542583.1 glutaredoxin family protein [Caldimonas sp.]
MTSRDRPSRLASIPRLLAVAMALSLAAAASQAQFKVTGADGKVTYTDREPSQPDGKVTSLGARVPVQAAEPDLPFELRQVVAKYPVMLYTVSGACEPCTSARQMLRQRGIPFGERQVVSAEDSEALERLSGAREAPTLTVGSQILRGYALEVWTSYLDAAGYPRDSRLPGTYQYRPATPLVERREPPQRATPAAAATAAATPPASPAPANPGNAGIKF